MDAPPSRPPVPAIPPSPPPPVPSSGAGNERTFAMLCHLSAFGGLFVPLGNIWGPLVFWLIKKDQMPEVDAHGKASLNFQISMTIYLFVSIILTLLLIGILFLIALSVLWIVCVIVASVRANNGELYRYPLAIPFFN